MPSLRTQSKTSIPAAAAVLVLGALTLSVASGDSLTIVNPNFSTVAVQCSGGYAYQTALGGTCEGPGVPQQDFNSEAGIGWTFTPYEAGGPGIGGPGITGPNTGFQPPSFTGMPFDKAAFLQNRSLIFQKITGVVPGQLYKLTFYLGSRYSSGGTNGNQTVLAMLDGKVIGVWNLVSSTSFTPRTAFFKVASGAAHLLEFEGTVQGTTSTSSAAFFSGVRIESYPF